MLAQFLGQDKTKEIQTSTLQIYGKVLVIKDTIYPIPNLSVIEVGELNRPIPWLVYGIILLVGAVLGPAIILSILLIAYLLYQHFNNKKYGLRLVTNSSETTLIVCPDLEFIRLVAKVIYNILNTEEIRNLNVNLDQRKITTIDQSDRSFHAESIGSITNSNISTGDVTGNISSVAPKQPIKIAVTPEEPAPVNMPIQSQEENQHVQQ